PLTLLVMPPINNTTKVEAKEFLYTSISRPLVEAGYYVISPLVAMDVFRSESAYDSEQFYEGKLDKFKNYFGVDAVVFSFIEKWAKVGVGIDTEIRYVIKSAHTGEVLFAKSCDLRLDLSSKRSSDNSLLSSLLNIADTFISTALTDHIVAARQANYYIFEDLPRGKYHPDHMEDFDTPVDSDKITRTVRK
ncbi:MAG: DUF799 family lipoprotein, partial [Bacteroidales bacterium]|nr:DUF799 family lipoprotein [Bacteroidales bacterium]